MGFFSALTGADTKKSSSGTTKTDSTQTQTGTVKNTGTTQQTSLDAGTIGILQNLIAGPLAGAATGGSSNANAMLALIPQLVNNTNPNEVAAAIQAGQDTARHSYAVGEGAQIGSLTQQIGSTGNSAAVQLKNQGQIDLATSLAQVAANVNAQARQQHGTDITAALSGYQGAQSTSAGPLTQMLAAVQALSGAQTTQTTDQTQLTDIINKVLGTTQTTNVDKSSVAQGFFPTLTNFLGAMPG